LDDAALFHHPLHVGARREIRSAGTINSQKTLPDTTLQRSSVRAWDKRRGLLEGDQIIVTDL